MQQTLLQEKYPVYSLELLKSETALKDTDAIIEYLKSRIADHKIAELITTFDHFAHTKALEEGEIAADILDAKHVLFCFGTHLTNALIRQSDSADDNPILFRALRAFPIRLKPSERAPGNCSGNNRAA